MDWAQQQCGKINKLIGGAVKCYDWITISRENCSMNRFRNLGLVDSLHLISSILNHETPS